MLSFVKLMNVHADPGTRSTQLEEDFWDKYGKKLRGCDFDENKRLQLTADLHDTVGRLCLANVSGQETTCTWWENSVLHFKPSRIAVTDLASVTSEQRASLFVIHHKREYCRIEVVIDLSDLTRSKAFKLLYKTSYLNLLDGLRLWSTIPHSIDKIHVILPSEAWIETLTRVAVQSLLSDKLKSRLCITSCEGTRVNL